VEEKMNPIDFLKAKNWLDEHITPSTNYQINDDGFINVYNASVEIKETEPIEELPYFINFKRFNRVWVQFVNCGLRSMRGFPEEVYNSEFRCSHNHFETLRNAPRIIHGGICDFSHNKIRGFEYSTLEEIHCDSILFAHNNIQHFIPSIKLRSKNPSDVFGYMLVDFSFNRLINVYNIDIEIENIRDRYTKSLFKFQNNEV
jgi:hypothetical protein